MARMNENENEFPCGIGSAMLLAAWGKSDSPLPPGQTAVAPAFLEASMRLAIGFSFKAFENVVSLESDFRRFDGGSD